MYISYNGTIKKEKDFTLLLNNRGFAYGDGLFETILFIKEPLYFEEHISRLCDGLTLLSISYDRNELTSFIQEKIHLLIQKNGLDVARIKVTAFRNSDGFYAPSISSKEVSILIECKEIQQLPSYIKKEVCFSSEVQNHSSTIANFKTLSSINYVLAGIEMNKKSADDIIILSEKGFISECLYSSIYWIKDQQVYTPPLSTGCIRGILRTSLLANLSIKEYEITKEDILKADAIFSSNVLGVYAIEKIGETTFNSSSHPIVQALQTKYNLLSL